MVKAKNPWKYTSFTCILIIIGLGITLVIILRQETIEHDFALDKNYTVKIRATGNSVQGYIVDFCMLHNGKYDFIKKIGHIQKRENFAKYYKLLQMRPHGFYLPNSPMTKYIKCNWGYWLKGESLNGFHWRKGSPLLISIADTNNDGIVDVLCCSSLIFDKDGCYFDDYTPPFFTDTNHDGFFDLEQDKEGCFGGSLHQKEILQPVPLIYEIIKKRKSKVKKATIAALLKMKAREDEAKNIVFQLAQDKDLSIRKLSLQALGNMPYREKTITATKKALVDQQWEVRVAAIVTLGKMKTYLVRHLSRRESSRIENEEQYLYSPIEIMREVDCIDLLTLRAINDDSWQVRVAAIQALGKIGVEFLTYRGIDCKRTILQNKVLQIKKILSLSRQDQHESVAQTATKMIKQIGNK
ncbi:HEAT repeat domain-containing protein [Candidatus Uabimicrobium sp. HlEnr_7]|uniref:HEAT repeat domain-containing protein n=1 Tax=Candidatus Uabimicrobium helgolandensis TaxID=3095367 RepID=UPI0035563663